MNNKYSVFKVELKDPLVLVDDSSYGIVNKAIIITNPSGQGLTVCFSNGEWKNYDSASSLMDHLMKREYKVSHENSPLDQEAKLIESVRTCEETVNHLIQASKQKSKHLELQSLCDLVFENKTVRVDPINGIKKQAIR